MNVIFQTALETEWKKRPVLPATRSSPPPSSAQKVHGDAPVEAKEEPGTPASATPALPAPAALPTTVPARTITPAYQHNVAPTASTSTSHYRPVPIRPKSIQRLPSPDADVDVVSPESDGQDDDGAAFQAERDPQSEEIVKQLEKGLPRWPGFGEEGWMKEVHPVSRLHYLRSVCSDLEVRNAIRILYMPLRRSRMWCTLELPFLPDLTEQLLTVVTELPFVSNLYRRSHRLRCIYQVQRQSPSNRSRWATFSNLHRVLIFIFADPCET